VRRFGACVIPENLIDGLACLGVRNLTVVSNNRSRRRRDWDCCLQTRQDPANKYFSVVGENRNSSASILAGELALEFNPQGTLAERIRAGGAGESTASTPRWAPARWSPSKDTAHRGRRNLRARKRGSPPDVSLIKAWKGDAEGNLVYPQDRA